MCLRCVHGYRCRIRLLPCDSLDLLIDLDVQGGICAMFWEQDWKTYRMEHYHDFNTKSWLWYGVGILRRKLSRVMREYAKPALRRP